MATVSATITVEFIANYAGQHRVCYRINNSGAYTCTTVSCTGGGATCSADISITVDNETCEDVEFDGYVQAACQDIASTDGRVPFSATFTPTPQCTRWTVTCNSVRVESVTVNSGGDGYDPLSPPAVSFSGGGGSGATATATVGNGAILNTTILPTNGGSGYNSGTYTNVPLLGGSGTGAQVTIHVIGGFVTTATITAVGNGYLDGEVLSPDPTAMGPSTPTTTATFTVTSNYGIVTAINITANGSGYISAPIVTIAAPGAGTQATATAVLGYCSEFQAPACGSISGVLVPAGVLSVGDTVSVCKPGTAPVVPSVYSVAANGNCLCDCSSYTVLASGVSGSIQYWYNDCDGAFLTGTIDPVGSPAGVTICAATGSVLTKDNGGATASVINNGAC